MKTWGVEPLQATSGHSYCLLLGNGRGEGAGRGQGAGLLGKEVLPAGGPGLSGKLQILYSRKRGFTVPAEPALPSPAVNSQQTGSRGGQNPRSASAV